LDSIYIIRWLEVKYYTFCR